VPHNPPEDRHLVDFVDTAAIGLHRVAADGTILWANEADYAPLGYTRDEYVGHDIREFHVDEDVITDILRRLAAGERIHDYEARLRAKDGTIRHVRITSSVLFDEGKFVHTRCFTRDVTEARRTEEALKRALEEREHALARAKEAVQVRDVFLAVAAHELRTPLTPLRLQVERLLRRIDRGEDPTTTVQRAADELAVARRQVLRLEQLVNNLLDVSRLASGNVELALDSVDLVALTTEVVAAQEPDAARAKSPIIVAPHAPLVGTWDRSRLEQVLANVISNAIKYGAGKPIEIDFSGDAHIARVTIRDHGPGVPEEDRQRIFDRFERAASARHYGGLGLGLWISRQVIELLRGQISVSGGPGATFTIELPRG
jgi:PAS domain S-box-containing protein